MQKLILGELIVLLAHKAHATDYDDGYNNSSAPACNGYSTYCNGVNDAIDDERKEYIANHPEIYDPKPTTTSDGYDWLAHSGEIK